MSGAHNYKGIKHLTIIEDAQYFAPQDIMKKNKITTYLEDIALLQRGTGECLITLATRPAISKEILANNGIVLTFKNHLEKDIMCDLLNLDIENKNYLSVLEEGQCIIRVNSIKEPFLLKVPYIKQESLNFSEIYEKNNCVLEKIKTKINSTEKFDKKIGTDKFGKITKLIKHIFYVKGKVIESNRNMKTEKSSCSQTITENTLELKKEVTLINSENRALNDLENYINKLYKMQSEKE
jgi:hypothetical protein